MQLSMTPISYHPDNRARSDLDLQAREIRIRGKGGTARTVKIGHQAARSLDRYIRARSHHTMLNPVRSADRRFGRAGA